MKHYIQLIIPALVLRYVILRKPLPTPHAIWVSVLIHLIMVGWYSGSEVALSIMSVAAAVCTSFLILWSGKDYHDDPKIESPENMKLSPEQKQKMIDEVVAVCAEGKITEQQKREKIDRINRFM